MPWIVYVLAGYLAGSLPTGVLLGRLKGRDPRRGGSGNIGASNVTRTLGRAWGVVTLLVDVAKGFAPTLWACRAAGVEVAAATAVAAVVGHCWSVWLRFRGGKGVATAFGTMAVFSWPVAVIAAVVWAALVLVTHVPAIGSLAAAALFVVLPHLVAQPFAVHLYALTVALVILVRHRQNLRELRARRGRPVSRGRRRPRSGRAGGRKRGRRRPARTGTRRGPPGRARRTAGARAAG
jgi:glycerol-3-phosphate acyltransferase PlsY